MEIAVACPAGIKSAVDEGGDLNWCASWWRDWVGWSALSAHQRSDECFNGRDLLEHWHIVLSVEGALAQTWRVGSREYFF